MILTALMISLCSFGQKLERFPFNWVGDSISGKYFDKCALNIPVTIDGLPHQFNMQFDLGASRTNVYGNSISPYMEKYASLKNKLDTTAFFGYREKKTHCLKTSI